MVPEDISVALTLVKGPGKSLAMLSSCAVSCRAGGCPAGRDCQACTVAFRDNVGRNLLHGIQQYDTVGQPHIEHILRLRHEHRTGPCIDRGQYFAPRLFKSPSCSAPSG
jgi:hypothetical protein